MSNLDKLRDEFDTSSVLDAIDALDTIRSIVVDGPNFEPPQLRADLLDLQAALDKIVNEDGDLPANPDDNPFYIADEIESQVFEIREAADAILDTLSALTQLAPADDDLDGDEEDE